LTPQTEPAKIKIQIFFFSDFNLKTFF